MADSRSIRGLLASGLVWIAAIGAGACSEEPPGAPSSAATATVLPFGERFLAVDQPSDIQRFTDPRGLELRFVEDDDGTVLRWKVGCNDYGTQLDSRTEFAVRRISGTDSGCDREGERDQAEATRLFESDPEWSLDDGVLRLASGDTEVELYQERAPEEGRDPPPFAAALLRGTAADAGSEIAAADCATEANSVDAILREGIYRFIDLISRPTAICTAELTDGRLADALLIGSKRQKWLPGAIRAARLDGDPPPDAVALLEEVAVDQGESIVATSCTRRSLKVDLVLSDDAYSTIDFNAVPRAVCIAELGDGREVDALLIRSDWARGSARPALPRPGDELDCSIERLRSGISDFSAGAAGLPTPTRAVASYLRFEGSDLQASQFVNYTKNRFRLRDSEGNDLADLRATRLDSGGYLIGRYESCGGALSG